VRVAIALNPDAVNAHYEPGSALYETGDMQDAAGHERDMARTRPTDPT